MKQGFVKSQKLEKWLKWMQVIHDEIQLLVWEAKMFWEVQDIIRNNPSIQRPNPFYRYLGRSYGSYALVGLRRQIKQQKDSISFVGLLEDVAKHPTELSLTYYRSCRDQPENHIFTSLAPLNIDVAKDEFSTYADASGEYVCPIKIKLDIDELKGAARACEEFVDKRIAHRDKREPKVVPTYEQIDNCINLFDRKYVKYHLLFYAVGMTTLYPEPQYDWKDIFYQSWLVREN